MDTSDYVGLLSEVSNNDETKFKPVALERRSTRGIRPHPARKRETSGVHGSKNSS